MIVNYILFNNNFCDQEQFIILYYYYLVLILELPHQSNWLVLQFYFKIPTSCYMFFRYDVMTFATITKEII